MATETWNPETDDMPDGSVLYLSEGRGIYIPQHFAEVTKSECIVGVDDLARDLAIVADGPDGEWYWEAWSNILDNAIVVDPDNGQRYTLYQDGDLWLVPEHS